MANALLSKIKVGGVIYNLKDAESRQNITTLLGSHAVEALGAAAWKAVAENISGEGLVDASIVKAYVDSAIGKIHNFDVVIDPDGTAAAGPSVTASAATMYKIYLVPSADAAAGSYIEYITIRSGEEGAYTYAWEAIGNTKVSLSGYVPTSTTIATIKLDHNITVAELQTALGLKALAYKDSASGTVPSQTISGVTASGTSTGALKGALGYTSTDVSATGSFTPEGGVTGTVVPTGTVASEASSEATAAAMTRGDYTPAGTVAVTPVTGTVKAVKSVGTQASFTEGAFTAATLTKTDDTFAKAGIVAAMDAEDTEMLVFSDASTGTASAITAFDGGSKAADIFTANGLPTTEDATVMTGASAAFTGTKEEGLKVTGVSYDKVTGVTSTFTGNAKGDAIAATFTGAAGDVSVAGKYDKADLGTVAFEGAAIELNVGDITVAAKEVTVE